ncbi:MAG TPA: LPS export ABC transporter permease LptG [Xanthomonadaceae bacterium]|nr:LPS export ABC transporter permease LptG [Xanthomonadaceae bacterium]
MAELRALRIHDRMVARAVLSALLPVWLILLGFDTVTAFAAQFDEIGEGAYGVGSAVLEVLHTVPRRLYELFPSAAVIGSILGMGALAATSELTALRAAGLSRLRISAGALGAIAALTAVMVLVGETLGPVGEQRAQALSVAAKSENLAVARWSGLWAREGETFMNARRGFVRDVGPESYVELFDVRMFEFSSEGRLASLAVAGRAEHRLGHWTLFDVRRSRFGERGVETSHAERERWDSSLDPQLMSLGASRPRYLSTADLAASLDYLRRNGLDTGEFEAAYWSRYFYPVHALVLCLAGLPFAFGTLRSGGFGKRLFIGVVFGVGYYLVLRRMAIDVAEVYRVDLRLANALPPLLIATASWWWFRRRA